MYETGPSIRMSAEDDAIIEGWALHFDGGLKEGRDLYWTRFSQQTRFHLDWFNQRPLLYQHGQDEAVRTETVGTVLSLELRDAGVWMKAQLDKASEFYEAIKEMVKRDVLALSSGALDYLVKIDNRTGDVYEWPMCEVSLTPNPGGLNSRILFSTLRSAFTTAIRSGDDLSQATVRLGIIAELFGEEAEVLHAETIRAAEDPVMGAPEPDPEDAGEGTESGELSYEDVQEALYDALNPPSPIGSDTWNSLWATYADHAIFCSSTYGEDCTYWSVPYTVAADGSVTLGTPTQVEQVFVPVSRGADAVFSLTTEANRLSRSADALRERTKDLTARRATEARTLSHANRRVLSLSAEALRGAEATYGELVAACEAEVAQATEVARMADPAERQALIDWLELEASLSFTGA